MDPENKNDVVDEDIDLDLEALAGDEDNTPDGDNSDNSVSNETELSEIEKVAHSQGWRPKDEFVKNGGDPKAWKEAGWWLDRGELLGQQSQLRKEVKQIKEAFIRMTEYNRQAYIRGQEDMLARMKADKRSAMKEGNLDIVADLDEKIDQVQDTLQVAKETQAENPIANTPQEQNIAESAVYQNWLAENRWYTTNEKLHNFANFTMSNWVKRNPNVSPSEALAYLTKTVKETYPQDFAGSRRVAQPGVNGRGNATNTTGNAGNSIDAKFQKIISGMDPDSRRAVVDMIRSENITKKEYVEMYQE